MRNNFLSLYLSFWWSSGKKQKYRISIQGKSSYRYLIGHCVSLVAAEKYEGGSFLFVCFVFSGRLNYVWPRPVCQSICPTEMNEEAASFQAVLVFVCQPQLKLDELCNTYITFCSPAWLIILPLSHRGQINGTLTLSSVIIACSHSRTSMWLGI